MITPPKLHHGSGHDPGRYRRLSDFDDLVAFSLITNTRAEHREAISFLKRTFSVTKEKGKSTLSDERIFDFDATRIYATLGLSDPTSPLSTIIFEIQVRTILQHAWSKVTHPLVYKSRKIDSKRIRLASEILAQLESIDRSLSRFATESQSVKLVAGRRSSELTSIVSMVDDLVVSGVIPSEKRPNNARRFSENIKGLLRRGISVQSAVSTLKAFYVSQKDIFPASLSLHQLAIVAFHRAGMLISPKDNEKYFYVTQEMISLFPEVATIGPVVGDDS